MTKDDLVGSDEMRICNLTAAVMLASALAVPGAALAFDESKYPDLQGQWSRPPGTGIQADPSKPPGRGQQPPLTPEYQAIWEASMADQAKGGQGNDPLYRCYPIGMARVMNAVFPMEIVVSPNTTYMLFEPRDDAAAHLHRRPRLAEGRGAELLGLSIGKWVDTNGDGRFDVLEVETRFVRGPHSHDASGIPFHSDNQASFKERIFLDPTDRDFLHDEVTPIDHALTQPWTIMRTYRRNPDPHPIWFQNECVDGNASMCRLGGRLSSQPRGSADAGAQRAGAAGSALFRIIAVLMPQRGVIIQRFEA